MKHKFAGNMSLKFASLFIAFLIWLMVMNVSDPTKAQLYSDVKIQVINEDSVTEIDKVFDIVSDQTVTIKVTERRSVLNRLSKNDFTVVADMENLTDMDTVPLSVSCSNPLVTWDEMEISPSTMKVKLDQRKQSEFVVNVVTNGNEERGYEVGRTEVVQGKTVQIAGSQTMLNRIGQVVATVNIYGIKSDQRLTGTLKVMDKNGDAFTEAQMSRIQIKDSQGVLLAENTVMVDVTVWETMNDIPVQVEVRGEPASGYRVASITTVPVTVNLVGTPEALADLNGKVVLNETIDLDGVTEGFTKYFDVSETLSEYEDIRLAKEADPTITVTVQIEHSDDYTLMLPLSGLEVMNRPENMVLTFSPADELTIVVHPETEDADGIKLSDIKAGIDLSVCKESGTYEIPVEVVLPEGYSLTSDVVLVVTSEAQDKAQENGQEEAEG